MIVLGLSFGRSSAAFCSESPMGVSPKASRPWTVALSAPLSNGPIGTTSSVSWQAARLS